MEAKLKHSVNQLSLTKFFPLILVFSLIAYSIISTSIQAFEFPIRTSFWDAKISIANIALSILFIAYSLSTRTPQLIMAFFWVFQFIFFGMCGLFSQIDPFPYYLIQTSSQKFLTLASIITLIAQVSIILGQLIANSRAVYLSDLESDLSINNFFQITKRIYFVLKLYLIACPFIIYQLGGPRFLFRRVRFRNFEQNLTISVNSILETLLYVPPIICLIFLIFISFSASVSKFSLTIIFIWIIFLSNPLANPRQLTLFLIMPLITIYLRNHFKLSLIFFIALPFVLTYSAGFVNRYTGNFQTPNLTILSRNGDFDAFPQLANGLQLISQGEFPIFRQIIASVLFFVPRTIFPNKPSDTGVELAKLLGLKFQNLSAPWILEVYVNARTIGTVTIGIAIGIYLTSMDLRSKFNLKSFVVSSITSGFLFIVLRGSLLQATGRVAFSYALIYVILRRT